MWPIAAHAQYSGSYGCTSDCSGHEAGYAWAERNDIADPAMCGGHSQSFIGGCMDYAEQRTREIREDAGCDADDDACDTNWGERNTHRHSSQSPDMPGLCEGLAGRKRPTTIAVEMRHH
jgi:hypothetical protein